MAIIKHIPIKGSNYNAALDYVMFQHDEATGKAILDENGNRILREEYYLDGINVTPMMYGQECHALNRYYHKNQNPNEVKAHHYIISFDPRDVSDHGLTGERAQQLGVAFAEKYFPGFQTIVCTHTDGHNQNGNIHVHIMFNSLRKLDVAPQPLHERPCDSRAGYKHHETKKYMEILKQAVMDMCRREHLHQVDLLHPAEQHIPDREYRAAQYGQKKLSAQNKEIIKAGLVPRVTVFQTQKQYLRNAIDQVSESAASFEDFASRLFEQYQITVTETRGRFSYLHPDRSKNISDRALGNRYTKDRLEIRFLENRKIEKQQHPKDVTAPYRTKNQHIFETVPESSDFHTTQLHDFDPAYDYISNPAAILLIRTKLRLVVDLQHCIKAQQSTAYAQKVKISNLQEMARTLVFLQTHEIDSVKQLHTLMEQNAKEISSLEENLAQVRADLSGVNKQIHYLGQYLSNKTVYTQMLQASSKKIFRQNHAAQIEAYEKARTALKKIAGSDPFPSMKSLAAKKTAINENLQAMQEDLRLLKTARDQLDIADSNIRSILGYEKNPSFQQEFPIEH